MQINVEIQEYIDKEIKHLEEKLLIINSKNGTALKRAEKEMERRLEGMNEFRDQLDKQAREFLTKNEYCSKHDLLVQKVDMLSKLVYIGIGMVLILEVLFRFII